MEDRFKKRVVFNSFLFCYNRKYDKINLKGEKYGRETKKAF